MSEKSTWDFEKAAQRNNKKCEDFKNTEATVVLSEMAKSIRASKIVRAGGMYEREDGRNVSNKGFKGSKSGHWISCAYFTSKSEYLAELKAKGHSWPVTVPVLWKNVSELFHAEVAEKFPKQGGFVPTHLMFLFFSGDNFIIPKVGILGMYKNPKTEFQPVNSASKGIKMMLMGAITVERDTYLRTVLGMTPLGGMTKVLAEVRAAVEETPELVIEDDWV